MVDYSIDEFEELMAQSRSGGRDERQQRRYRLCKSLPTSPVTSPKRSPDAETKPDSLDLDFPGSAKEPPPPPLNYDSMLDSAIHGNLLCPPDPFQEIQNTVNGSAGGARPKLARMSSSPSKESFPPLTDPPPCGIRRTQSCRRPASIKRHDQPQFTYRQRAHANAWRQHANQTSTDDELDGPPAALPEEPPPAQDPLAVDTSAQDPSAVTSNTNNEDPNNDEDDLQDCKIYRVRSFRTTTSGIVNKGDSFKIKSRRQSSKHNRRGRQGRRVSTDTNISHTSVSREDLNSLMTAENPGSARQNKQFTFGAGGIGVMDPSTTDSPKHQQGLCPGPSSSSAAEVSPPPQTSSLMPYMNIAEETIAPVHGGGALGDRRSSTEAMERGLLRAAFSFDRENNKIDENDDEDAIDVDADDDDDDDDEESHVLKVVVVGMNGVGKRTMIRQLLTSEYLANTDRYQDDDQENVKIVSVMLDDEESMVQFVDIQNFQEAKTMEDVDAYIVVYSVTDRNSFAYAHMCLQDLTKKGTISRRKVIILVGNKQDIVRNRMITEQEGRSLASHRHSKYTEVSALLDHKVDELLVGIIRQIRINQVKLQQLSAAARAGGDDDRGGQKLGCLQKAALGIFRRLFRKRSGTSQKNCDNLLL